MHKILSLFAATIFAAMALLSSSTEADARRYHRHGGAGFAIAAAVIGGIALHAISRRQHRRHYYSSYYDDGYGYGYYPRQRYYRSYHSGFGGFGHRRHYGGHHNRYYSGHNFNNYAGVPGLRPMHHGRRHRH